MDYIDLKHRVGWNLRSLRASAGLTQEEFGKLTGRSGKAFGRIERAEQNLRLDTLELIARSLAVDALDLLQPIPPGATW